jgi:hypothetical protein
MDADKGRGHRVYRGGGWCEIEGGEGRTRNLNFWSHVKQVRIKSLASSVTLGICIRDEEEAAED